MSQKKLFGRLGNYCCVHGCKSAFYNKNRDKTNIPLFSVPERESLRREWLNVVKYVHRKGSADSFDVKKPKQKNIVCELHFKDENLTVTLGRGKKKVLPGRVPSLSLE